MKQILRLVLGTLLAVTSAVAGDYSGTNYPRAIPAKIDTEFKPQDGVEYTMEGGALYHHDWRANPGPAEVQTSTAWSIANEFVYRTALVKEYVVPAGQAGPTKDGWCHVHFTSKDGKTRLIVEVHTQRRVARLPAPRANPQGSANG